MSKLAVTIIVCQLLGLVVLIILNNIKDDSIEDLEDEIEGMYHGH